MKTIITGGCVCESIRYEINTAPEFSIICQCRRCQRTTGSGHAAAFAVLTDSTTIYGDMQFYSHRCDDGHTVNSGFCNKCGNPILNKPSSAPQLLFFHAATLDNPAIYKPDSVVYSDFKQAWDIVDPSLPRT